ncbi:MAG TPA: hypothetical protein VGL94_18110 [Ktedonobacteraceae bacterium]|jgi:hypothetical protein
MSDIDTPTPHTRKSAPLTAEARTIAQEKFLHSFSMTANIRAACMSAGIHRSTIYYWKEHDETFSARFHIAEQEANDIIRAELFRRAIQGVTKPVVSLGKVVYQDGKPLMERVYSDNLLSLLAKARLPEFREKHSIEHSGSVQLQRDPILQLLTDEELATLQKIVFQLQHRST